MKKAKIITVILTVVAVLSVVFECLSASADAEKLSDEVFRLHVIAESDSEKDQALKLKVRDAVLGYTADIFASASNASEAAAAANEKAEEIKAAAEKTIKENGYDYDVDVSVGKAFFPTKYYGDDIALPAGNYNALRIVIGSGKGQNWWCVLFPQLCLSTSIDRKAVVNDTLSPSSSCLILRKNIRARFRFKLIEELAELFG